MLESLIKIEIWVGGGRVSGRQAGNTRDRLGPGECVCRSSIQMIRSSQSLHSSQSFESVTLGRTWLMLYKLFSLSLMAVRGVVSSPDNVSNDMDVTSPRHKNPREVTPDLRVTPV